MPRSMYCPAHWFAKEAWTAAVAGGMTGAFAVMAASAPRYNELLALAAVLFGLMTWYGIRARKRLLQDWWDRAVEREMGGEHE